MSQLPTRRLGASGPDVSVICLGGWPIGGGMGAIDEKQAIGVVHAALDHGVNFIDTAEGYRNSEEIIGKALVGRRDRVFLATKLSGDHSASHIRTAVENSLRALRTDHIDLYQIHHPKQQWPIAETMAHFLRLKEEGKISWIGVSNFSVEQLLEAAAYGEIVSAQPQYSMIFRGAEQELFPYCREHEIGTMIYGVMVRGLLSGKYSASHRFAAEDDRASHPSLTPAVRTAAVELCNRLTKWAEERGHSMVELAIAWTLANAAVTTAICGAKTPEQVAEHCRAGRWELQDEEKAEIDRQIKGCSPGI